MQFAAQNFMRDTGRSCGDFFKTLSDPLTRSDPWLGRRPTLLRKIEGMSSLEVLVAGATICARSKPRVPPRVVVAVEEPFTPSGGPFSVFNHNSGWGDNELFASGLPFGQAAAITNSFNRAQRSGSFNSRFVVDESTGLAISRRLVELGR